MVSDLVTKTRFFIPKDATDEEALAIIREAADLAKRGDADGPDEAGPVGAGSDEGQTRTPTGPPSDTL
jgi:hypothetical protein